ncbi:MAG: glycerophosphodiester phosphodiesterase family protein, partial [Chloroflexota bacterium]
MLCIGHRGAMGHEPENTLRSIQKALDMGVAWIEIDVYAVEGELVVIHDHTLERTTNGQGAVMEQSLAYLRSLDAGKGEQIPLLGEVMDLIDRRVGLNIELKGPETAVPTTTFLHQKLTEGWQYDQLLLSSFNFSELEVARRLDEAMPIGVLSWKDTTAVFDQASSINAKALNPHYTTVTADFVQQAHARGSTDVEVDILNSLLPHAHTL